MFPIVFLVVDGTEVGYHNRRLKSPKFEIRQYLYEFRPILNLANVISYYGSITTSILLPWPSSFLVKACILAGVILLTVSTYFVAASNPYSNNYPAYSASNHFPVGSLHDVSGYCPASF